MRRIRLSTLVMSLLLLLSALAPIMLAPRIAKIAKAQGGKSIPITIVERSGNDLANYTVKVELTADNFNDWDSILYDNGTDVYFTDSQGTPLYYWVEYFNKTEKKAIMWVKIPSISANEILTINMHYGADNPYKEYMNGTKTFIFFDDFDGNDLDPNKWSTEWLYGASYTVADSIITITSGGIRPYIHTLAVFTAPFAIRAKVKKINSDIELSWFITSPRGTTSNPGNTGYQLADRVWQSPEDIAIMKMSAQSWIELASVQYTVTSGWHIMEVFQKTDGIIGKIDEASVSTTDTEYQSGYIALSVRETSGDQVAYDWIFVRNLTEPEPYVAVNWTSGIKGSYYVPITIQERSGSNLTDYSVKIVLNSTNFHYWNHIAYWNGSDIYFTDEAGNPLYYWIESFDLGRKNATIWVKIPSIPANGTVTIHMHYGADNPYKDYMNRSAIFLVYDDFDDGILDTTTNFAYGWIDWSGWSSQTYIIHFNTTKNGIVKEENSNVYMEGAYLEAVFYACRHNVIGTHIECALKWTKTKARWRVALMNATDLASLDGQNFRLYANLIVSSASWSLSTTTFETFKIDVLNTTTVRVVLPNGTSIYVDVELGNGVAYVWFDTGNEDTNLYIDFIRIRRHICVYPEPSISYIGIEVGGAGILLRCFDKLLNKLNYEPLKILLVNKTTGEVVAELTGRYEFFIDTQLPQGTYLIIIKFMGVVLRALEVYFNATARVEVNSTVPALSLLADYRGLSRSFICNKTIVDVEDLNPKFPYSRSRILVNGTGHFKLFINYQGDLPSGVSVSSNVTNLQYYWNGTYLIIEGDLGSIGEVNITDLYKIRLEVYDRLGNLMPSWIYAYINNTKYTGSAIEDYYYPEDYVIKVPGEINGFKFYRFFDGYNSTVRNITVSDSDVVYKVWYLVATNITMRVSEIAGTATVASWLKQLFARLFQYEEEMETVKSTIDGYVLDYYGNGVPNRRVLINITNTRTGFTIPLETTTDASGYFSVTTDLVRGDTYNITICFLGDDIYADTSASMLYTVSKAVAPAPAPAVAIPIEYVFIGIASILLIAGLVAILRTAKHCIEELHARSRKFVRKKH